MAGVVAGKMKHYQTDFTEYDKPEIEKAPSSRFPYLWIVSEMHTSLPSLGGYEVDYFNSPRTRYAYANGDDSISFYLNPHYLKDTDLVFIITDNDISEVSVSQAKAAINDYTIPVYLKWKVLHGDIVVKRVSVKFDLIDLVALLQLIRDCRRHHDDSLLQILRGFHRFRRVADDHTITVRYRKHENEFVCIEHYDGEDRMVRYIIFHGWPETGYKTNGSIQIKPKYGWASHT